MRMVVKKSFCANHAVHLATGQEKSHGHNWNLEVEFTVLQENGIGDQLSGVLDSVILPLEHCDLNEIGELRPYSASAEALVRYLYREISRNLVTEAVEVASVKVEEEEGSWASYMKRD